jgi:hypothetical protein
MFHEQWSVFQTELNIDGDAATYAYRFAGDLNQVRFLRYDVTNLAYFLPDRERVLIIGVVPDGTFYPPRFSAANKLPGWRSTPSSFSS